MNVCFSLMGARQSKISILCTLFLHLDGRQTCYLNESHSFAFDVILAVFAVQFYSWKIFLETFGNDYSLVF